jgi:phosphoribosylanthranilate isomerase
MTWIKICGITNLEDALMAVEAGADALGFVFYEKSPRNIDAKKAREISAQLPAKVEKVGVFVMACQEEMEAVARQAMLTGWQLHKDLTGTPLDNSLKEGGSFGLGKCAPLLGRKAYISMPAALLIDDEGFRGFGWSKGVSENISALFVDSGRGDMPGGTGKVFDWKQLEYAIQCLSLNFKVVVAGGLSADNVGEAIRVLKPWGVDVSSGVEAKPGKKDPGKVRAFIAAVRSAEKSL